MSVSTPPHVWSQYERDQFLTRLRSVEIIWNPDLEPISPDEIFELVSRELAKEKITKTPQECHKLYDELVKKGSIAVAMEEKKRSARFFERHLTELVDENESDRQLSDESEGVKKAHATTEEKSIKPALQDQDANVQDKDKNKTTKRFRRFHFWSVKEDQRLYEEYKAHFENDMFDDRSDDDRWDSISRSLEAQGFPRRSRGACKVKKEYKEDEYEQQSDTDVILTEAQQDELEVSYKINENLDMEEGAALGERVGLTVNKVKWFEKKSGRATPVNPRGRSRKRKRSIKPRSDEPCLASPVSVSRTSHMAASSKTSIKPEVEVVATASGPPLCESLDAGHGFSEQFADVRKQERKRLESLYEERHKIIQEVGDDVKKHESEARNSLLAVQKFKRKLNEEQRKLELLRKKIEGLDMLC